MTTKLTSPLQTVQYRFELCRIAMASLRRDAMNDDDAFALTLELQGRLDNLRTTMPSRLKDALDDPFSEGRRLISVLILSRATHAWFELQLHGRHYAQGWTDPDHKYDISRQTFYRSAVFFVSTFLEYWQDQAKRVTGSEQDLDSDSLAEMAPTFLFRVSYLAPTAFALVVQLERHAQLMDAYPQMISEDEKVDRTKGVHLTHAMHELRTKLGPLFNFDEAPSDTGIASPYPTFSSPVPPLPVPTRPGASPTSLSSPSVVHPSTTKSGTTAPTPHPSCSSGSGSGDTTLQDGTTGQAPGPDPRAFAPLDTPMPFFPPTTAWGVSLVPPWEVSMLLQQPDVQPLGFGGSYDGTNGLPVTFEDLLATFRPPG